MTQSLKVTGNPSDILDIRFHPNLSYVSSCRNLIRLRTHHHRIPRRLRNVVTRAAQIRACVCRESPCLHSVHSHYNFPSWLHLLLLDEKLQNNSVECAVIYLRGCVVDAEIVR